MFLRIHKKTIAVFSSRSPAIVVSVSLLLLSLLGWLDYLSGDYSLIVFYLVPVSLVAWFVNRPAGMVFCLLALMTRFAANEYPENFSLNSSSLHYWNEFVELLFLLIMSLLFSALRKNLDTEKNLASMRPPDRIAQPPRLLRHRRV